jgi:hypothetical protein
MQSLSRKPPFSSWIVFALHDCSSLYDWLQVYPPAQIANCAIEI